MTQSFAAGMGLCEHCLHRRLVRSERQADYLLCEYSKIDPAFEKYPRLPVKKCSAYLSAKDAKKHEEK